MHLLGLIVGFAALVGEVVCLRCSNDRCLQAVNRAPLPSRISDCESLFRVTAIPSTRTSTATITVITTGTTTKTTVATTEITAIAAASRRWEEQHEALEILLRRSRPRSSSSASTSTKQKTPSYASPCTSLGAYSSACSCLGVQHTTVTAPTPYSTRTVSIQKTAVITKVETVVTTQTYITFSNSSAVPGNFTKTNFGNSTTSGRTSNTSASLATSSLPSSIGFSSTVVALSNDTQITGGRETVSSNVGAYINSTTPTDYTNSTTSARVSSKTTGPVLNSTTTESTSKGLGSGYMSGTFPNPTLNVTTSGLFLNSTLPSNPDTTPPITQVNAANATTAPFLNATTSTGLSNATSGLFINATTTPLSNASTSAPYLNVTSIPYANLTTSSHHLNATSVPWLNTTVSLPANTTSVRFSNTSSPTATSTPTTTLDLSCGETKTPFLLQVSHPSSLFDGWYAKVSGDQIIFTSSANHSDRFSVESSGHLCAVGYVGDSGSPTIAIVETKDGLTGSAIYFVDGQRVGNLTELGYGALDCAVDDDLACQARDMTHWVACGLGLDIANDGSEMVVVDSWNCTSVALSAVYG